MTERHPEYGVAIVRRPWYRRLNENTSSLIGVTILAIIVVWGLFHMTELTAPWFSGFIPEFTSSATSTKATTLPKPEIRTSIKRPSPATSKSIPTTPKNNHRVSADIVVRILSVGAIDRATGAYVVRPAQSYEVAAVQFDVANAGTAPTGPWYFEALLPTQPGGFPYMSDIQNSLNPGDHIINTLQFAPVMPGGGTFGVTAHVDGVSENVGNNTATTEVPMGY